MRRPLTMDPIDPEAAVRVLVPLAVLATVALGTMSALAARSLMLELPPDALEPTRLPLSRTRSVLRGLAGGALVAAGVALLVLPGPGVMLITMGAMMLAPSWRGRIARSIMRQPRVMRRINAFRRRHGRPELEVSG